MTENYWIQGLDWVKIVNYKKKCRENIRKKSNYDGCVQM